MASLPKKRVSVSFVDDDDVVQHIIESAKAKGKKKKQAPFASKCSSKKKDLEEMVEGSSDEADELNFRASSALAVDDGGLSGGDVFQFRYTKKDCEMAEKATEASTPKSILKSKAVSFTPSKADASSKHISPQRSSHSESDSEDSSISSEEYEDCDVDEYEDPSKPSPSTKLPLSSAEAGLSFEHEPSTLQDYFDLHASGAVSTSDHTLSKLHIPSMDKETLNKMLSSVPERHVEECAALYRQHRMLFRKWMLHMCHGFNILLYGLGSKRNLLEDFQQSYLKDFSCLVVNGYFPSLTIKDILNGITEDIFQHKGTFRSPLDQCEFIRQEFEKEPRDFYLIIHNIDGSMLRNEKAQNILSLLSQAPGIHILASVDHINSSLVWDQAKCSHFNWLWFNVTTFSSYTEETSYENSILVQQSGALALSSLIHVMKSLTPNAQGIFLLLAKYQLKNKDISTYPGMPILIMYEMCREAFLVNSDLTFKAQLTEFRDHKLIRSKKCFDGRDHLLIPIDSATLTEFIEQSHNL
ncbi:hypothetical protein ACJMK2_021735 [Sinanodonta woodiana]|uniref:Origin recognition complex subunit 2 n=1 Tax=Sinanodonta woodiana TaxID=1069815 RepID=A0ABD3TJE9_SINWO